MSFFTPLPANATVTSSSSARAVHGRGGDVGCRAAPRGGGVGGGRVVPRPPPFLVALAAALPVELLPLVALLGLDLAAQLDVRGKLAEEPRGRILVRASEELAPSREREVAAVHRAGDRDVAEPALLLDLPFVLERARLREDALLHPGHDS